MNSTSNVPEPASTQEPVDDAEVTGLHKLVLWMFLLCFAGIGIILIWDLIAGLFVR
ncbi:MAG: hypothetical protein HY289_07985 [Planctomycetes bacterium]|nr:hypothetical protein [Planctomycetota bacterium]